MSSSTTIGNHPSEAVLLDHVSGTLSFAHYCVVATHLLRCSQCRNTVRLCEEIKDHLLARVRPVDPPPALLQRCLVSVDQHQKSGRRYARAEERATTPHEVDGIVLPPSLDGVRPGRLRRLAPGIRHSTLWHDERGTLHFLRVRAGVSLPAHNHHGLELTCVLGGAFRDDGRLYAAGDISEEDDADESHPRREWAHVVAAEPPEDCACILATTGRLRFSGPIARLLQPVMPF